VDKWTATDWGNWKMTHYDHPLASEDGPGSHEDDRLTECGVRAEYDCRARVVRGR
jgi:hypothetical protein